MNAIDLLISDHQKVKGLFDSMKQCTEFVEKREIFDQLREELEMHSHLEETVFYPAFSEYEEFADLLEEAYADHEEVLSLLEELEDIDDEDEFESTMGELIDAVETHVEIEESEFFPKVLSVATVERLEQLGTQMLDSREEAPKAA